MAFRGGLGPVFAFEWLTVTRRWQLYAWRAAFVGLLLIGLGIVWIKQTPRANLTPINRQAQIGREFYQSLVFIELMMVLLAGPAATAGAICLDKARGTLLHVLVTDLSDGEIVLGKLAARLVPVVGLVAGSLPVMALGTLLGGIDPVALTGAILVILGLAVLGCALTLTLSIWGKKTHEVLLTTYVVWVVWILVLPGLALVTRFWAPGRNMPVWLTYTNPFGLTVNAHNPSLPNSPGLGTQALFLAAALLVSASLVALSVVRLRPVIIDQCGRAERSRTQKRTRMPVWSRSSVGRTAGAWEYLFARAWGPTLDGNPVLWREWHRRRPTRWARYVWGLYIVLAIGFSAASVLMAWRLGPGTRDLPSVINGFQATIGLLMLSVTAATSLSEERARGSLDVLLATPLPTSAVVWGKWWGAFRTVPLLAILPGLVAAAMAWNSGRWIGPPLVVGLILAYGAAITSLGLAVATWIPQVGRVVALCVGVVVFVTVGSIFVVMMLFPGPGDLAPCLAMVSPFFGVGFFCSLIEGTNPPRLWPTAVGWVVFWAAEYATAAGLLLVATLVTFDRCLGRISERSTLPRIDSRARRTKRRKPAAAIVEEF